MPLILAKLRDALFLPRPPSSATLRALQFVGALRTACSNGSTPTKDFLNSPRSLKNPSATADYSPPLRYPWLAANACEELAGIPKYQVIKLKIIAPDNAEKIIYGVISEGLTNPTPKVLATLR